MDDGVDLSGDVLSGCQEVAECLCQWNRTRRVHRMDDGVAVSGDVLSGCQEVAECLRIVSGIGRVETIEWTTVLISAATFSVAAKK